METAQDTFGPVDDSLHQPSDNHYETETYWFSFFVPERAIGGWLYSSIRANVGVTAGGAWMWDDGGVAPWDLPFYENFSHLKLPREASPGQVEFPTGMSVAVVEPGMSYDLVYDDRDRFRADLRFDGLEQPVPLRAGAPPYPRASHYDQTGRVTGTLSLDGERIEVDCFAMRDRSWGPRYERGYRRVGYTWAASPDLSLLTYTGPEPGSDAADEHVHSGYVRRDGVVGQIVDGRRAVRRDPLEGWVTGMDLEITDEHGRTTVAQAEALSRMVLPGATSVCINTSLRWTADGRTVDGEDQDVWPIKDWRRLRRAAR